MPVLVFFAISFSSVATVVGVSVLLRLPLCSECGRRSHAVVCHRLHRGVGALGRTPDELAELDSFGHSRRLVTVALVIGQPDRDSRVGHRWDSFRMLSDGALCLTLLGSELLASPLPARVPA